MTKRSVRKGTKYTVPDDRTIIRAIGLPEGTKVKVVDYTDDRVYLEDDSIGIVSMATDDFVALQKAQEK